MFKKILLGLLILILLLAAAATTVGWWLSSPKSQAEIARMQSSRYFRGSRFLNPERQAPFELSWARVKEAFFDDHPGTSPAGKIPVITPNPVFLDSAPEPGLRLIWLGHSSVLLEVDGKRILLDPVLSERTSPFSFVGPARFHPSPIPLEQLRGIDVVLISHNHYDHMDEATLRHLAAKGARIYVPLGMAPLLEEWKVPDDQIKSFDWWAEEEIEGLRFIATPARHYSNRGTFDYKKTFWLSWSIIGPKHRVFFSGDTGYSKDFRDIGSKLGPFDLGVIKVGAYGPGQGWKDIHMEPEDSIKTAQDVRAKIVLPVHWGTFNLAYHPWAEPIERTIASAGQHNVQLVVPRPGEQVDAADPLAVSPWWQEVK